MTTCINKKFRKVHRIRTTKKNQIQTLSSKTSEILINQQKFIEQNEKNDSEKVFIKKDKN